LTKVKGISDRPRFSVQGTCRLLAPCHHLHFHCVVIAGVFAAAAGVVLFTAAIGVEATAIAQVQAQVHQRLLRACVRRGFQAKLAGAGRSPASGRQSVPRMPMRMSGGGGRERVQAVREHPLAALEPSGHGVKGLVDFRGTNAACVGLECQAVRIGVGIEACHGILLCDCSGSTAGIR
jgi:hypothetical protein